MADGKLSPNGAATPLIRAEAVTKIYQMGDQTLRALDNVSLSIDEAISWPSWAPPDRASRR